MTYLENLEQSITEVKKALPGMTLLEREPMSAHDSIHIGGPVRALAVPSDVFSLTKICDILHENRISPFILGNGTNIAMPDEGLDIFVVSTEKLQKMWLQEDGSLYAEAGVSLARLAQFAQQNRLAGLEFASGIPGSVGGGILMNAGAYGGEMKDAVRSVVCYNLPDQGLYEVANDGCDFSYRHSFFETVPCIILAAVFVLTSGSGEAISAKMKEFNEKRRQSQPLDLPSAGSAFKRPEGGYAAALIEQAGLKGYTEGGVQVSEKHSGFVVNRGSASYDELVALMTHVRDEVFSAFQIKLEPEIKIYPRGMTLSDHSIDLENAQNLHNLVENLKAASQPPAEE